MIEHKISGVPVVDNEKNLNGRGDKVVVGIIGKADVVGAMTREVSKQK